MSDNAEIGSPSKPVAPSGSQVPEPQLWPLLYDLNGTVSRIEEAISGLKDRANSLDSRLGTVDKDLKDLTKEVSSTRGSIRTLGFMLSLIVPVLIVLLEMIFKHFKLL
jgi:hypothetical protein